MPVYDYECASCGTFDALAPMAEYKRCQPCPGCGAAAERVLIRAPMLTTLSAARRNAFAVNERSAHAPDTSRRSGRHPAGCGCCKPKTKADGETANKSFPGRRPWMISHA